MQLTEDNNDSEYQIQAYEPGEVTINDQVYRQSLILTPNTLITEWPPTSVEEISQAQIQQLLDLKADIVLMGVGNQQVIPPRELRQFECMENAAACRTFVALSSEGRNVAVALLIK